MNGDPEIAITHFGRAARLSPFDPFLWGVHAGAAFAHFLRGDYDEAASRARQVLRDRPNFLPAVCIFAASRALCGHIAEAQGVMTRLRERAGPSLRISLLKDRVTLRRPEHWAKLAEGLRLAGMGE
jgi:hypothetical protein